MIDAHALSSVIDLGQLIKKEKSKNIQIADIVHAMALSEPCLFNNSEINLMPVTKTTSLQQKD